MRPVAMLWLAPFLFGIVGCSAPAPQPGTGEQLAEIRAQEVESAARIAMEGQLDYRADPNKKVGADYCRESVALADRGELRLAIRAASKALFLGQTSGNQALLGRATLDLGTAYFFAGYAELAEAYAKEAVAHGDRVGSVQDPPITRPATKLLGDIALRKGDPRRALELYAKAAALLGREGSAPGQAAFLTVAVANAHLAAGELGDARNGFIAGSRAANPVVAAMARRGIGDLAMTERKYAEAIELYEAAVVANDEDHAYERLWSLAGVARARRAAGDNPGAIKAFLAAIDAAETIRARFRSEEFKTGFFGEVQDIFDEAVTVLAQKGDAERALEVSERSRARAMADFIRNRVVASEGRQAAAPATATVVTLQRVQAVLPRDTAVLVFHQTKTEGYAWTLRRNSVDVFRIDLTRAEMQDEVRRFRIAAQTLLSPAKATGPSLYARLVAPAKLSLSEGVIVVAHDFLHYLPFQALPGPNGYLIQERAISYAPSLTALADLLERSERRRKDVVAFGNPDLGSPKLALPGAEREVQRIQEIYPASQIYLRSEATKQRLLAAAPGADVLHIAAHASVDLIDPLYSKIYLGAAPGMAGTLEANEIYRLGLRASAIVTLSACESGLGRVGRGDEQWGFTRTFLAAGADDLVVSLWKVDDAATAMLMSVFYEKLRTLPARDALRLAQLAVLSDERYAHPVYWAAFNLIGDPQ